MTAGGLIVLAVCIDPGFTGPPLTCCLLLIGLGSGLFLTPNTSAIMLSVRPDQRGVANGLRSALQNTGFVFGTAASVAIVTSWLTDEEKRAAYAGTLSRMTANNLAGFTTGYRTAFAVMALICLLALVASVLRNPPPTGRDDAVASPARAGALAAGGDELGCGDEEAALQGHPPSPDLPVGRAAPANPAHPVAGRRELEPLR